MKVKRIHKIQVRFNQKARYRRKTELHSYKERITVCRENRHFNPRTFTKSPNNGNEILLFYCENPEILRRICVSLIFILYLEGNNLT